MVPTSARKHRFGEGTGVDSGGSVVPTSALKHRFCEGAGVDAGGSVVRSSERKDPFGEGTGVDVKVLLVCAQVLVRATVDRRAVFVAPATQQ